MITFKNGVLANDINQVYNPGAVVKCIKGPMVASSQWKLINLRVIRLNKCESLMFNGFTNSLVCGIR